VASILKKKRQHVTSYVVEVSGVRRDEYPRRFMSMKVHPEIAQFLEALEACY
jgi:uncharacterized OsmC-like protein